MGLFFSGYESIISGIHQFIRNVSFMHMQQEGFIQHKQWNVQSSPYQIAISRLSWILLQYHGRWCFAYRCHQDIIRYKNGVFIGPSPHFFFRGQGVPIYKAFICSFICLPCILQLCDSTKFITVTSKLAQWHLKSPVSRSFAQSFVQAQIKENTKTTRYWPLQGGSRGECWIPLTKGQLLGKYLHLMTSSCY